MPKASPSVTHDDLDKAAAAAEERQISDSKIVKEDNELGEEIVLQEAKAEGDRIFDGAGNEYDASGKKIRDAEGNAVKGEPSDNAERTRLGRKVASMDQRIGQFGSQLSDISQLLDHLVKGGQSKEDDDNVDDEQFISVKDLPMYLDKINSKKSQADQAYQSEYVKTISGLGSGNGDHDAVFAEMMENFNVRHSNNAALDAQLNYERARNSLLSKGGKLPLKGDDIRGGGVDSGGAVVSKTKTVKLSGPAMDLLNRIRARDNSWTDEKVAKTLSKPKPHLTRG